MTRRSAVSGVAAAASGGGFAGIPHVTAAQTQAASMPGPVTARLGARLTLYMFQTGWVAVKAVHKAFSGPAALQFLAIMASRSWAEWLPIAAFVIDHPEGLFVVDIGETARMLDRDCAACDPGTGLFYSRNLRFDLAAQDELGPQMWLAGLEPDRVSTVIMTHLHSDHMGGMGYCPRARFFASQAAMGGHTGALTCRIPAALAIRPVQLRDTVTGVFPRSVPVTADGAITAVPTPGPATWHQSVLVQVGGVSLCVVGDTAFTLGQIDTGETGGIVQSV